MIRLTRINHVPLVLNADLIEHVETTPDTVISLTNGQKFVVLEPIEDVIGWAHETQQDVAAADHVRSIGEAGDLKCRAGGRGAVGDGGAGEQANAHRESGSRHARNYIAICVRQSPTLTGGAGIRKLAGGLERSVLRGSS